MRTYTISNHKGGVGKTTSTVNLGAGMARAGKRVLLIDADPQANLTQSLGAEPVQGLYRILKGEEARPQQVYDGLDLIPADLDLAGAEIELAAETGREFILKQAIAQLHYEVVLIDAPPSLGLLTVNALTASDRVLIPIQAEYLAVQGLARLLEVIEKIRQRLNPALEVAGVFLTQYDGRRILNRDIADSIQQHLPDKLLATRIRNNVALAEAPARGQDIYTYQPNSNGAIDYTNLTEEILKHE